LGSIAFAKIFPPIGIARVGDSENEFFFGPEFLPSVAEKPEDHRYRDAQGCLKRQAARFRVYGFDSKGRVVREITSDHARITWTANLANKKAAWFRFDGASKARQQFANDAEAEKHDQRNAGIGKIVRDRKSRRFVSDAAREALEIDGGAKSIEGRNLEPESGENGDRYRFKGYFKRGLAGSQGHEVYLGELRTDDSGRLIVLGGRGNSEPVGPNGPATGDARLEHWIVNYANNDDWHDDTSDGPINARVLLKNGREIKVVGGAWVVVAPPDFAPDVSNLVTMYDVMEEVAIAGRLKPQPGCPPLHKADAVCFRRDIEPILQRMNDYRWVSPLGLRGHGHGKPGEAGSDILNPVLSQVRAGGDAAKERRERYFSVLRVPTYPALDPLTGKEARVNESLAAEQATSFFMPPLSGDEGDRTPGNSATWFSVTRLHHARMERWKDDDLIWDDEVPAYRRGVAPELHEEPARLTRCTLEACVGGAFFPGIEITSIVRDPELYCEPFRIDHAKVGPGDVTKFMACPWQADFYECRDAWWPAARPDAVVTDLTFEELFASFEPEKSTGFEAVMFGRERWDRGLERKPRPPLSYLLGQLLPDPTTKDAKVYARQVADSAADRLLAITPALGLIQDGAPTEQGVDAERLLSPWRLQYLVQEQLDGYSGRFFTPAIPSPEDAIELPPGVRSIPEFSNLGDIRRNWGTLRITHTKAAGKVLVEYASKIQSALRAYILDVVAEMPKPREDGKKKQRTPALQIQYNLKSAQPPDPQSEPQEFTEASEPYRRLRGSEFVAQLVSRLFLRRSIQAPDMSMVDEWRNLGIVRRRVIAADEARGVPAFAIQIETERDKYDGRSFRDYFYYLMNIEQFDDFLPFARVLAHRFLDQAQQLIDQTSIFVPDHPESFVPYTAENFTAKLEQIYEILRADAARPQQYVYNSTRQEQVQALLGSAPFNQTDGAWLRQVANAGTMGEVTAMLFEVWSDEVGNGDPSLHHGNLFTSLLLSLGLYLPDVTSRAYADERRIEETNYVGPVFELAISQHSQEFLPEIIGMTLFLEWEVLSLVPRAKRRDYFGIDSQFWRMHIGIDNATEGHGAKAKRAVGLYLDQVFRESGPEAQQEHWKRIWRGFVAFAVAGYDLFTSVGPTLGDTMSIEGEEALHARTPADRVADIVRRKLPYGQLNHLRNRLGIYRINDLFDDAELFLTELANSPWIAPGDPDASRFMSYLTTFKGPMYKVFDKDDLATWREWIDWLGREGDTQRPKRHIRRADAMMILLAELRQLMLASPGHHLYTVPSMTDPSGHPAPLIELFKSSDLKEIMRTLRNAENGWVVKFRPAESALIVDLMRPGRGMGAALDQRFAKLFNQVGRMVVYEWIAAGCPLPGEMPDPSQTVVTRRRPLRLFVQQYGMGAVH